MTPVTPDMPSDSGAAAEPAAAARKRAVRRPGKPDAVLADAAAEALAGLLEVADPAEVGEHAGISVDAERVVTHRFVSLRPGYRGWHWYATVARAPRSKKVTVSEVGLLPSDDALLAPEWVPWSERLRPEDLAAEQEQQALEEAAREQAAQEQQENGQQDAGVQHAEQRSGGPTDAQEDE